MKTLLIGPAGSGKTHRILDEFERLLGESPDPLAQDAFLILPSSEHVERVTTLLVQRGIPGFFHHRVTTLNQMIQEVFGIGQERLISNTRRFAVLGDILRGNSWEYFQEIQDRPGFLEFFLQFISELKDSLIPVQDFRERMNRLKTMEPDLALKYEALASLYEAYEERLRQEGLRDRQDLFWIFQEKKKDFRSKKLSFRAIFLDGFFDFSPLQLAYVAELSGMCGKMIIALTQDTSPAREPLFEAVNRTGESLKALGFLPEKMPEKNWRAQHPALAWMEKYLFGVGARSPRPKAKGGETPPLRIPDPAGALAIFEAVGIQGEVEMIAREIRKLTAEVGARHAVPLRFSDIAVLLREVGPYEAVIRSVFARYEIPVEIHEREWLSLSPWMHTVVSLFLLFKEGWRRPDLLNFLRSSYLTFPGREPVSFEWLGAIESAAVRGGIVRGREAWLAEWTGGEGGSLGPDFHEKKKSLLSPIAELEDALREAKRFSEIKKILVEALDKTFGMFEILPVPFSQYESLRRDGASVRRFHALLEEMRLHLAVQGREEISFEAFTEDFLRLVEIDLYSVHHRDKNRVQVYDVSLARQKEYRVVFTAGLLEKSFPVLIRENPVLSDWERELANADAGHPLGLQRPRQGIERYLFYLAVTRAREKVFLTYPYLDREGKEALPSFYIDEVRTLFDKPLAAKKQDLAHPYPGLEDARNRRELEAALIGGLWHGTKEEEPLLLYLTRQFLEETAGRNLFRRVSFEVKAELQDARIAAGDYFRTARTSPTNLEEYAKCPYKYFSGRVLRLQDPWEDVNARRQGNILHEVLEKFFRNRLQEKASVGARHASPLPLIKVREFIEAHFQDALKKYPLIYEKSYQYQLAVQDTKEKLFLFILSELERLERSPFQPAYFELNFGVPPDPDFPPLEIEVEGKKVQITGRIDRIDTDPEKRYALVLDYKRSAKFDKKYLDLGTALQLPLYLKVAEELLRLKPVGGEIYSVKDIKRSGFYHEKYSEEFSAVSRRSLVYSESEFRGLLAKSEFFIRRFLKGMMERSIPVRPRQCESYCPYSSVCRIEKWKLDSIVEEIKEEDRKVFNETHEDAKTHR